MKALDVLKSPIVEIGSDSDLNLHSKAVVLFATREQIQDAIAELEALQQPKTCAGCIRLPFILIELAKRDGGKCGTCKRFVKDHYELEPNEQ